jgi:rare lipoprotein A
MAALSTHARAQAYERSWNTNIVAAQLKSSPVVTNSLPSAGMPKTSHSATGRPHDLTGLASYYWQPQMTSSGERFDKMAMTAAHKTLPMHSRVKVTQVETGRSVVVRINDRGPFKAGRVIDLSDKAAEILGFKDRGLTHVKLEVLGH